MHRKLSAYATDRDSRLFVLDIGDPHNPSEIGSYYVSNLCNDVVVKDTLAFVVTDNALRILNISDLTNPTELAFQMNIFCGPPSHLDVLGQYVYVQCDGGGLYTFQYSDTVISIAEKKVSHPKTFQLYVHPNPFNSSCIITAPAGATIEICDLQGKLLFELPNPTTQDLSSLSIKTDKSDSEGHRVIIWTPHENTPSGIYFVRAHNADGQTTSKRVAYLK